MTAIEHSLNWQQIIECLDAFVEAWEDAAQPPDPDRFLGRLTDSQKRSGLIELLKIDLEYRWRDGHPGRHLEDYLERHPTLLDENGDWPLDLIYEEFHIRRQMGDEISPEEYQQRFPQHSDLLKSLLKFEAAEASTSLHQNYHRERFEPGQTVDDFDLLLLLGEGSFAQVFLARQISMQRLVALKISEAKGEEHKTLAQLDHPHIVRVFSQTVLPDRKLRLLYMQYHPGGTLKEVVDGIRHLSLPERNGKSFLAGLDALLEDKGSPIPQQSLTRQTIADYEWPQVVCWLGARLSEALDYSHRHDVLHRDLKPANVLLADDGAPKLADFNISFCKQVEGSNPVTYFGGSLAYMSPEQLAACDPTRKEQPEDLDGRSDLYSLGMILWELLVGKRPFTDLGWALSGAHMLGEMIADRERGPEPDGLADSPPLLKNVLLRTLAPEKESRIATGADLARQLDLCIDPEVERILTEPCNKLRCAMLRFPTLAVLLLVTICNGTMSILNIVYNGGEIVEKNMSGPFYLHVVIVNVIAYGIGLSAVAALMLPVRDYFRDPAACSEQQKQNTRTRILRLGYWCSGISISFWLICGIVFPLLLHLKSGTAGPQDYLHFFASHLINGSLAAAAIFFLTSDFAVGQLFPRIVNLEMPDPESHRILRRMDTMSHIILAGTICLPMISILLAVGLKADRTIFGILAVLGLFAVAGAYRWSLNLRRNSAVLQTMTAEAEQTES